MFRHGLEIICIYNQFSLGCCKTYILTQNIFRTDLSKQAEGINVGVTIAYRKNNSCTSNLHIFINNKKDLNNCAVWALWSWTHPDHLADGVAYSLGSQLGGTLKIHLRQRHCWSHPIPIRHWLRQQQNIAPQALEHSWSHTHIYTYTYISTGIMCVYYIKWMCLRPP